MANGFVKIYLTNHLANTENERRIEKWRTELRRDVISVNGKYSARGHRDPNFRGQTLIVDISDNQNHKTSSLPDTLNVCIVTRVILTANINTSDCLMNGSIEKIEYMQMPIAGSNLVGIIYIKFDNVGSGNSLKIKYFKKWIEGMYTHHSCY